MSADPSAQRPTPAQDSAPTSAAETPLHAVPESEADREARIWLETVYQGDRVKQLTPRAIVTGMMIGGVMSISNLYVGLKTGWGLGVTITACIIAFGVFRILENIVPAYRKDHFTILENNTMASAASAAGYMSSAGLVSAFPALLITTGRNLLWWEMSLWLCALSVLGVFMAVPLKRQLINVDKLPFPTGIATAETLKSMHTKGAEAMLKAKSLVWAAVGGAILAVLRDAPFMGRFAIPAHLPLFPGEKGRALSRDLTLGFEGSLIMLAAGAIMGIRIGFSLLLGAIVYYGVLAPWLIDQGIAEPGYRSITQWTLWPATAMMTTAGLLSFALRWRTVMRAFGSLTSVFRGKKDEKEDILAHVEVPTSWFVWGTLLSGAACVIMGQAFFGISWWMGVLAVLATFLLSIVAARATGETDITPIGALGKITQLIYGVIAPANLTTNLMTASITSGAAAHSADLLTDLKSGYLVGGNPRKQTIAQLFGVLAGTIMSVPVYLVLVRPETLGTADLPAPAAQVWAGVAQMLAKGLNALPPGAVTGMIVGGLAGIVLTLLENYFPNQRKWIPSPVGLGIAGVIPAFNSVSMFLGAFGAWLLFQKRPKIASQFTIPVSSGLIAGESLMGVGIILIAQAPELVRSLFGG